MIKELIIYPDERIKHVSADVRKFDDELFTLLENMQQTMDYHGLEALSAIQIAVPACAIILKSPDGLLELINPRIIVTEGTTLEEESSAYFPVGFSTSIKRYDTIKVVYENRHGELGHLNVSGNFSRRVQQQIDFLFGGSLLDKMDKDARVDVLKQLEKEGFMAGESCPTVFVRDYFKRGAKILLGLIALTFLIIPFVASPVDELLFTIDKFTLIPVPLLMGIYYFYALYEARRYKQCTSCQMGNIIGTLAILGLEFIIVTIGVFFWVNP
jgi:peptide deformylase